jgi:hypothetical protein
MILGVVNGIIFIKSKQLKKRENHLIKIMLLIRHGLFNLLISAVGIVFFYISVNSDVELVVLTLVLLCLPISWVICIVALIKWIKSKKEITTE